MEIVNRSAPTVFVHGGNFAKDHKLLVEAVLPFAFPYGTGGPKMKHTTTISLKSCIQRYFCLALPQFMTADVVLVLHQLFSQQLSYKTGIMTCRNQNPWEDFGKMLSRLTSKDFEIPKPWTSIRQQCGTHCQVYHNKVQITWPYCWSISGCKKTLICNDEPFWFKQFVPDYHSRWWI